MGGLEISPEIERIIAVETTIEEFLQLRRWYSPSHPGPGKSFCLNQLEQSLFCEVKPGAGKERQMGHLWRGGQSHKAMPVSCFTETDE